jgi:hypothetical protein
MRKHPGRFSFDVYRIAGRHMKTKPIALKPRNPLVAAALHRKAGAHRRSRGGIRHRLRMALQREMLEHKRDRD